MRLTLRGTLPSLTLQHLQASNRILRLWVIAPQCLRESPHSLFEVSNRLFQLTLRIQQVGHVVDREQRARVAVAQRLPARLQRLLEALKGRNLQPARALSLDFALLVQLLFALL